DEVLARLESWTTGYRRVRVQSAAVLTPDDLTAIEPLRALVTAAGWTVLSADERSLLIHRGTQSDPAFEAELSELLRANGYAPLTSAVHPAGA
ncbi:MAG: hypothetical protein ACRDJ9_35870, partial [Dehalococcoidia bacterium]